MNSLLLIDLAYDLHADRLRWAERERIAHTARMARNPTTDLVADRRDVSVRGGHRRQLAEMETAGR